LESLMFRISPASAALNTFVLTDTKTELSGQVACNLGG
jgi:hypothetical protein